MIQLNRNDFHSTFKVLKVAKYIATETQTSVGVFTDSGLTNEIARFDGNGCVGVDVPGWREVGHECKNDWPQIITDPKNFWGGHAQSLPDWATDIQLRKAATKLAEIETKIASDRYIRTLTVHRVGDWILVGYANLEVESGESRSAEFKIEPNQVTIHGRKLVIDKLRR